MFEYCIDCLLQFLLMEFLLLQSYSSLVLRFVEFDNEYFSFSEKKIVPFLFTLCLNLKKNILFWI